jgi:RNA polymerase sigma-70 factor (ECF subfamily)
MSRGETAALADLYDRYSSLAYGLALRILRDPQTAEEVVQDVFLAVWRRAASYRPERGEVRSWLLSAVHHRAIDRVRGRGARGREIDLADAPEVADRADVWQEAWSGLERGVIVAAVNDLPDDQRRAIELAFFAGLPMSRSRRSSASRSAPSRGAYVWGCSNYVPCCKGKR